jgi:protein TonB
MELKKSPQADLENERTTFFLLGFTVVLALLFIVLEWSGEPTAIVIGDGRPPLVIENEYTYNALPVPVEPAVETKLPEPPKVVYDDYHVVEEAPERPESPAEEATLLEVPETPPVAPPSVEAATGELLANADDAPPQFPGGAAALNQYLFRQLKYPASAVSQKIEGRVWCSFTIDEAGAPTDVRVERGVYLSLDQEAVRVLQTMPAWIPGTLHGRPVRVKVYVPIVFKL